ncbi:MAG: hypothetical protein OXC99_11445 [Chloroflexi bacterium]|nr:hypothetical protein [Chloroflexota bacterium]
MRCILKTGTDTKVAQAARFVGTATAQRMNSDGLVPSVTVLREQVATGNAPHVIEMGEPLLDERPITDDPSAFLVPANGSFAAIARGACRPALAEEVWLDLKGSHAANPGSGFKGLSPGGDIADTRWVITQIQPGVHLNPRWVVAEEPMKSARPIERAGDHKFSDVIQLGSNELPILTASIGRIAVPHPTHPIRTSTRPLPPT